MARLAESTKEVETISEGKEVKRIVKRNEKKCSHLPFSARFGVRMDHGLWRSFSGRSGSSPLGNSFNLKLERSVKANSDALLVLVSQCFKVGHSSCVAWNPSS